MKKIINPWLHKPEYNCFGCCPENPIGLHIEFYEDGEYIVSIWHLRIDTHRDNKIMQHNLTKHGFSYCGVIYLASGDERLAYQRSPKAKAL